jgi:hypothetical protein
MSLVIASMMTGIWSVNQVPVYDSGPRAAAVAIRISISLSLFMVRGSLFGGWVKRGYVFAEFVGFPVTVGADTSGKFESFGVVGEQAKRPGV